MPPRQGKASAPAGRIYKSVQPLQQAKFPHKSTRVRSYGSALGKKVPKLQKQDTLTQMDFVMLADREFEEDVSESDAEDDEGGGVSLEEDNDIEDSTRDREHLSTVNVEKVAQQPQRNLRARRQSVDTPAKKEQDRFVESLDKEIVDAQVKAKSAKKKSKRRRTLSDEPESEEGGYTEGSTKRTKSGKKIGSTRRRTLGDQPVSTRKSTKPQFHTQTITQLDWGVHPYGADADNDADPENLDSDSDIFDVPNSSQILKATQRDAECATTRHQSPDLGNSASVNYIGLEIDDQGDLNGNVEGDKSPSPALPAPRRATSLSVSKSPPKETSQEENRKIAGAMGPPQTPKRIRRQEIPSSESPATPAFLQSGGAGGRTPLQNASINIPIPFNPTQKISDVASPKQMPKLVIEDTFDTGTDVSQMQLSTDKPCDSPYALPRLPKMIVEDTFDSMDGDLGRLPSTPSKKSSPLKSVRFAIPDEVASSPVQQKTQKTTILTKSVIHDSDESDDDYEEESQVDESQESGDPPQDSDYGDFGAETQYEVEQLASTADSSRVGDSQTNITFVSREEQVPLTGSPILTQSTQLLHPPRSVPLPLEAEDEEDQGSHYEEKTQFHESQRLHTQHLNSLAPRTLNSDIFVSIASLQMTDIASRARTHDIRAYALPVTTVRLWYYVAKPICKLTYMAVIAAAKRPGELDEADKGIGSKAFNKKGPSWRAYEIEELYELADPLTMDELKKFEWLKVPPKKFEPVRPAVSNHFIANLMPPIFSKSGYTRAEIDEEEEPSQPDNDDHHHTISSSHNDTQDATEQLLNTMKQFTQFDIPSQPGISMPPESSQNQDRIPSSQDELMLPPPFVRSAPLQPGLSQATTVDLTQTQHPTSVTTPRKLRDSPRHEIVWESPTRPVNSNSTPARLPMGHRGSSDAMMAEDSMVVPMSIPSSQMLTKSQMDEELVFDSIPAPPLRFVEGSDEEDEIEDDD